MTDDNIPESLIKARCMPFSESMIVTKRVVATNYKSLKADGQRQTSTYKLP